MLAAGIRAVVPTQTLLDLDVAEGDLQILVSHLEPFYLEPQTSMAEPLPRARAAAKHCLRDPALHGEFARLYLNSVAAQFRARFRRFVADSDYKAVVAHTATLAAYYARQTALLGLLPPAQTLFDRGLAGLFRRYLEPAVQTHLPALIRNGELAALHTLAAVGLAAHVQEALVAATTECIHSYVRQTCARQWARACMPDVLQRVCVDIYPSFVAGCAGQAPAATDLAKLARNDLVALRVAEVYDMVAAYPALGPALDELHECFALAAASDSEHEYLGVLHSARAALVDRFAAECALRLLHQGCNTPQIAVMYISTIKAFLRIDPTGVLLDKIARPVRRYLKTRGDLVLHLVQGMLEPDPAVNPLAELAHDLQAPCPPPTHIDDLSDLHWCPDPSDALPDFKKSRVLDMVEALTSIFPLPAPLIDEFTKLFGSHLLSPQYRPDDIMKQVELLKMRFGLAEFAVLDVMIRDIIDSAGANEAIAKTTLGAEPAFSLTILSKMYWPSVLEELSPNDNFTVPVQDRFEAYSTAFRSLMRGRDLTMVPSLGTVVLDITVDGTTKEYRVTPSQATIISVFDDDLDEMSLTTVAMLAGMTPYAAAQALKFWVDQGVVRQNGVNYRAVG